MRVQEALWRNELLGLLQLHLNIEATIEARVKEDPAALLTSATEVVNQRSNRYANSDSYSDTHAHSIATTCTYTDSNSIHHCI